METLKISSNNFWIRLYCFIYNINLDNVKGFPKDTCSLRKNLLFGIPLLIIGFPVILINYIIKKITKGNYSYEGTSMNPIFFYFVVVITLVSIGMFRDSFVREGGILGFVIQSYFFNLITVSSLVIICIIVLLIIYLICKFLDYLDSFNSISIKKGVVKELYRSAKEKYCKKIEYVN